ncbi:aspartate aminotransferase family protein [Cognatishimia activa]|uniref:L-Lysine-8-amino-7-oxononanoate aminotransferase n=1 Tax=Cognatishimia activa TaxID=1715691 RepID=A0A0P1IXP5_9RHOB|nr:aspartate aminotransferase family protein [Cognatishimia activa]CUI73599.1 L-Lysine-8-amino-7-oxononanoate aminotransferase [Cognatishimia activa]CUK26654.1 L-Lysine-8-amino-7-oxononanoate aminotransferase [Cognatishimia activa]
MSHVFPRNSNKLPPIGAKGAGVYLYDKSGKAYFDGSGGAAVSCLGHGDQDIIDAIKKQLDSMAFAHTGFLGSEPAEQLADLLVEHAPEGLNHVYFVSGGSEAVEAALKLARQYFIEIGQPERSKIIARKQSYHGNTLGALAVGGNEWRRAQFAPLLIDVSHISPCYEYRGRRDDESAYDYGQRMANELEAEILRLGPEQVMAFVAEPVVGATMGGVPSVEGYFKRIREICDQYGVLLILDEVMCGMGRTGTLFAAEQEGISPDICTIAKGLGAGYQPIGAMMCSATIYDAIKNGSGFFQHGHTYIGHPTACAAGLAVVQKLTGGIVDQVTAKGNQLQALLRDAFGQNPYVGDIRGRGLFVGMEFVSDRESKAVIDPAQKFNARLKAAAFEAGLICYPMGGTIDGKHGDHVLLAPPFISETHHLEEVVHKLSSAVAQVTTDLGM